VYNLYVRLTVTGPPQSRIFVSTAGGFIAVDAGVDRFGGRAKDRIPLFGMDERLYSGMGR
jgi:hypothetical protein